MGCSEQVFHRKWPLEWDLETWTIYLSKWRWVKKGAIGRGNNTRCGTCPQNSDWFSQIRGVIKDVRGDRIGARGWRWWILRAKAGRWRLRESWSVLLQSGLWSSPRRVVPKVWFPGPPQYHLHHLRICRNACSWAPPNLMNKNPEGGGLFYHTFQVLLMHAQSKH